MNYGSRCNVDDNINLKIEMENSRALEDSRHLTPVTKEQEYTIHKTRVYNNRLILSIMIETFCTQEYSFATCIIIWKKTANFPLNRQLLSITTYPSED
jgi:hypothetical protein